VSDFDQRFEKAFAMVAFAANRHLIDHMRRLTRELDVDLETVLIWGTLAHLNVSQAYVPGAPPHDLLVDGRLPPGKLNPVRQADVAQVCGLPKETVRRKLGRLQGLGKVRRLDDGSWAIVPQAVDANIYEFTRETVRRLMQTADHIDGILRQVRLE
jgi:CRP-like cAMP-binding protein